MIGVSCVYGMVVAVMCFCFVVQAVPPPGRGAFEGFCNVNEHCYNISQCCVTIETVKYSPRMDIVIGWLDGKCEPIGTLNSDCMVQNNSPSQIYEVSCPCGPGLTCVGIGLFDPTSREFGNCEATDNYAV